MSNNAEKKIVNAIDIGRVSSDKQGLMGDSLDDQEKLIQRKIGYIEEKNHCRIFIKKHFAFMESASGDLDFQPLLKAAEYCKDPNNKIKFAFIKSIDRVTRAGGVVYGFLKAMFTEAGVTLVDAYGVINSENINTLAHLNVSYKWSNYNPTYKHELLEAESAKEEVTTILSRMIGAEIRYVRLGYRVRPAPFGFQNQKIETSHGIRVILTPNPPESIWIVTMFELRSQGNLSDLEIVNKVNVMGYKSRRLKIRDKFDKANIIGYKGEKKLTVKQLLLYIQNPIYAGINTEKWVEGQGVKTQFKGLVSIEVFNKANRGKKTISLQDEKVTIQKGKGSAWSIKRNKDNPLYPYKRQVLCSICHRPFLGSAPRGKFPTYHCGGKRRGHKYYGIPRPELHKTIENFIKNVQFSDKYFLTFRGIVLEEYEKREKEASCDSVTYAERVMQIEQEIRLCKDKIKVLDSLAAIKLIEEDIEKLLIDKAQIIQLRDEKESEQFDLEAVMRQIKFYMEHFEELLLGGSDPIKSGVLFGLIFDKTPTYEDLLNGTVQLAPLFKLNEDFKKEKSLTVGRDRVELSTSSLSETRSTAEPTTQFFLTLSILRSTGRPSSSTLSGTRSTAEPTTLLLVVSN